MATYQCGLCSYIYDEDEEGVRWEELPDDWVCPVCGSSKDEFLMMQPDAVEEPPTAESVGVAQPQFEKRPPEQRYEQPVCATEI